MSIEPHLHAWLSVLQERGGTDLLLTEGAKPFMRVDGQLGVYEEADPLSATEIKQIVLKQLGKTLSEQVQPLVEFDFSFSFEETARIRGNVFFQRGSCSLSLRRIPMEIPSLQDLGLPEAVAPILRSPSGLILVTGPTGSGKSTSMAAMIDLINQHRACHIVTIEDPIEYLHTNKRSAISQREVGTDTASFPNALRSVLREDPDVVLVGEMRDLESIAAALTIAETGHLVITTLHTNDSAQSIDRIIDVFSAERRNQIQVQLASTLLGVVYQRLLPKRGGGMVAAYELMTGSPATRNLVREGKTRQLRNVVATHRSEGMQTLEHSLNDLMARGLIDLDTALEASLYPQELNKQVPADTRAMPLAPAV